MDVRHTHSHASGTDTMGDIANIPLERTPREGFLRTGLADKAKERKGCETGLGQGGKKKRGRGGSWRQVNASGTMIGDERPSPPLHNQHIVNWAHQRTNPGHKAWKHCVPSPFLPFADHRQSSSAALLGMLQLSSPTTD